MSTAFLHIHSTLRYILLALLIVSLIRSLIASVNRSEYKPLDNKIGLFLLISAHLQLVIGLIMYFFVYHNYNLMTVEGAMQDPILRWKAVEHMFAMIIAIGLITIGRSRSKKASPDVNKFKVLSLFNIVALLLILFAIPTDRWFF